MTAISQLTHIQTSELRHFWPGFPPKQASRHPQIPQPPTLCCEEPSTWRIEGPSAVLLTAWKLSCEKNCLFHLLNQLCIAKASCFQVLCGLFRFGSVSSSCLSCLLCSCSSEYLGFRGSFKTGQILLLPPFTTHPTLPWAAGCWQGGKGGEAHSCPHLCSIYKDTLGWMRLPSQLLCGKYKHRVKDSAPNELKSQSFALWAPADYVKVW